MPSSKYSVQVPSLFPFKNFPRVYNFGFKSGITTTALIWNGKYSPQLISVKASQKNRTGIANYANAITLTPGTVTIEVDKKTFLVHALSKKLSEDLQTDDMNKVITDLDK